MSKKNKNNKKAEKPLEEPQVEQELEQEQTEAQETPQEEAPAEVTVEQLQQKLESQQKEYLLLMAEFDNFRRRTLKEKQDLIKTASEKAMLELLPVVDDFERALNAMSKSGDVDALAEGVNLIYTKMVKYLEQQGVKPIESTGKDFDPDLFDAITTFPAPDESMRGKVVDTTTKGYTINDKVLRHAQVVVGQ
ncbi:MAG: nucleotide exchange factor GrpE [Muribaculaceae bacterium]|nr:nucleotide exchange factor GrpE [Muribaculaceae bacterium]